MSLPQNFHTPSQNHNYLPAVLKENKSGWLIEYYVEHPQTKRLTRKQIRLKRLVSRYSTLREARLHISKIITSINIRLSGGWNPFFENEDARFYEKLNVVADLFLKEKTKELRENTMRSYRSFINILLSYVNKENPHLICSLFNHSLAIRYMDYIYNDRNVSATTYNNHLKMGIAFFNWCKEKNYSKQNPFERIKKKTKVHKKRIIIPKHVRQQITDYLIKTDNIEFLVICKLVYNSLIRPKEILLIKIEHINVKEKYIVVPAENAKNHKTRYCAINDDIISDLQKLNLKKYPKGYYLFGSYLRPSADPAHVKRAGKEWVKLRKALNLPAEMQLYSLRDTGIFDMLKAGIDDLSVMQHANHSSLDITSIYANHHDPNLIKTISTRAPKF